MSTPPNTIAPTVKMKPMTKMYQLIRLIFGNATSLAPIISGRTKLPRMAGTAGISTKNTIAMPCIVNSLL